MSATEEIRSSGTDVTGEPARRSLPLLIVAGVLVVVVVATVLAFGINRPPELASLADQPAPVPTGSVAWTAWRSGESCVFIARPDATVTEVRCDRDGGEIHGWTQDGNLVVTNYGYQSFETEQRGEDRVRVLEIDPDTGAVLDTRWEEMTYEPPPGSGSLSSYHDGGEVVVEYDGRQLWRVEAPEGYSLRDASLSPDGRFVAVTDGADRLLVMPADGSAPPRVWVEDVSTWTAPVWEGHASG
jgi:hypothetical protein